VAGPPLVCRAAKRTSDLRTPAIGAQWRIARAEHRGGRSRHSSIGRARPICGARTGFAIP
jgi:hypothetical protein